MATLKRQNIHPPRLRLPAQSLPIYDRARWPAQARRTSVWSFAHGVHGWHTPVVPATRSAGLTSNPAHTLSVIRVLSHPLLLGTREVPTKNAHFCSSISTCLTIKLGSPPPWPAGSEDHFFIGATSKLTWTSPRRGHALRTRCGPPERAIHPLYAYAVACDKQWAQQMSPNTVHKHIERQSCKLRGMAVEDSAWHT